MDRGCSPRRLPILSYRSAPEEDLEHGAGGVESAGREDNGKSWKNFALGGSVAQSKPSSADVAVERPAPPTSTCHTRGMAWRSIFHCPKPDSIELAHNGPSALKQRYDQAENRAGHARMAFQSDPPSQRSQTEGAGSEAVWSSGIRPPISQRSA